MIVVVVIINSDKALAVFSGYSVGIDPVKVTEVKEICVLKTFTKLYLKSTNYFLEF
ncbi:hypothetical protein [Rickettsia bellii]|uniref:hypothetical protein n=1 Tax=Rickettsia bellii TaxID=33990 RepID=UPI0012E01E2E|nr:hypothetical protein [Rickettsia bellii]